MSVRFTLIGVIFLFISTASAQIAPVLFHNNSGMGCRVRISYFVGNKGLYQSWHFVPGEDPKLPCKCGENCNQQFPGNPASLVQVEIDGGPRSPAYRLDQVAKLITWRGKTHWSISYTGSLEDLAHHVSPQRFPNFPVASTRYSNVYWNPDPPSLPSTHPGHSPEPIEVFPADHRHY